MTSETGFAFRDRNWERLRGCCTDDAVIQDHRPGRLGKLTIDEWLASARALVELARDAGARCSCAAGPVGTSDAPGCSRIPVDIY